MKIKVRREHIRTVQRLYQSYRKPVMWLLILGIVVMLGNAVTKRTLAWMEENNKILAYQVTVDGQVWAVLPDKDEIEKVMARHKMSFLQRISSEAVIEDVRFAQDVLLEEVRVQEEDLSDFNAFAERFVSNVEEAQYYTIEAGDTIWQKRQDLGLEVGMIQEYNPDLNPERIWPGDVIMIKPADPVIDVEVYLQTTQLESTPFYMDQELDSSLYTSQYVIVKPGVEGEDSVTRKHLMVNGYEDRSQTTEIARSTILEPVNGLRRVGTKRTMARDSKGYGVADGRLSSGYGYRTHPIYKTRTFHSGIDIANARGTTIRAYADGTVESAGWSNSYGYTIVINHGNGLKTRYAHMLSDLSVKAGDKVSTGQKIGRMGSTGVSTGNHLHFEVIKNGSTVNPLDYL